MTKEQFLGKVKEMLPELNDLIVQKAESISKSGCIDFDDFEDNFFLPKVFISAMGEMIRDQYRPLSNEGINVRDNISYFL
jgi:hypothetical protein